MLSRISRFILAMFAFGSVALQPAAVANAQADCLNGTPTTLAAEPQKMWGLTGGTWRIFTTWTNQPNAETQAERKLEPLAPEQYVAVLGGGTLWTWPAHCERQVRDNYDRIQLPAISVNQLSREWLCCDTSVLTTWEAYWNQSSSSAPATVAAQAEGCPAARHVTLSSPTDVEIAGVPAIVHPWWNNGKPPWGQTQTRTMMRPENRTVFVQMMGEYWLYENSAACNSRLDSEIQNAPERPRKEIADYRAIAGLTR